MKSNLKVRLILITFLLILNSCYASLMQNLTEKQQQFDIWSNNSHFQNNDEANPSINSTKTHYCSSLPCNLKYCYYYKVKIDGTECLECGCE